MNLARATRAAVLAALATIPACRGDGRDDGERESIPVVSHCATEDPIVSRQFVHVCNQRFRAADLQLARERGRLTAYVGAIAHPDDPTRIGLLAFDVQEPRRTVRLASYVSSHPRIAAGEPPIVELRRLVGRRYAFLARQDFAKATGAVEGGGFELLDIAAGLAPVADYQSDVAGHSLTVWKHLAFTTASTFGDATDVVDVSEPTRPRLLLRLATSPDACHGQDACQVIDGSSGHHDVVAQEDPQRLYLVGNGRVHLLDPADLVDRRPPYSVTPVSSFRATTTADHARVLSPDGRLLVIAHEREINDRRAHRCPGGGFHVWDVSNACSPRSLGVYHVPDREVRVGSATSSLPGSYCTAHYFDFLPGYNVLAVSNYRGGVWLVDLTREPSGPEEHPETTHGVTLGGAIMPSANVFSAAAATQDGRVYVYASDMDRGLDIFEWTDTASLPAPVTGTIEQTTGPCPECGDGVCAEAENGTDCAADCGCATVANSCVTGHGQRCFCDPICRLNSEGCCGDADTCF